MQDQVFSAKWEIEEGYDYVQLQISTNGYDWTALEGNYTVTGNGNQASGEPLYDGFQTEWIQEEVDVTDYIGNSITFRFILKSDGGVVEDGFYFDDFEVKIVEETATSEDDNLELLTKNLLSNPIPNPANGNVRFEISGPVSETSQFIIYSSTGQKVYSAEVSENTQKIELNISNWEAGIYYYKLEGAGLQSEAKKLVIIH